jgi:hypothetical protein
MNKRLLSLPAILFLSHALFAQGSLTPPGAPGPTMKTLGQIEPRIPIDATPFHITKAGSYYLTSNLLVAASQVGISIETNNVSLDLGGFALEGDPNSLQGILLVGTLSHVSIKNGVVHGTAAGIDATSSSHVRIDSVRAYACRGGGFLTGNEGVIFNSLANQNVGSGIKGGNETQVESCQANGNTENGIQVGSFSSVVNSTASKNSFNGVSAGEKCNLTALTAAENSQSGLVAGQGGSFTSCNAAQNKADGIAGGVVSVVTSCAANFNQRYGISVAQGGSVLDSGASGNGSFGVLTLERSRVINSKADGNGGGISAQTSSTVRDCDVNANFLDGILVTSECSVIHNRSNRNTRLSAAAGIHATGTGNHIEENSCFSNDRGIGVDAGGNFIFKNTTSNNSLNYYINGDQSMGPIVTTIDPNETLYPLSNFAF